MRITIEKPAFNPAVEYPLVARHRGSSKAGYELYVMFINLTEGFALKDTKGNHKLFELTGSWTEVMDETVWEILPKGTKITILM